MTHAKSMRAAAMLLLVMIATAAPAAARQRVSAELESSKVSVVNRVAEATFKVVIKNDEEVALEAAWLVFDDGFEVSVGDVAAEASGASESTTRTFDLSEQPDSLNIPLSATLKYSVDGAPVEQAISVTLRLQQ